MDSVGNIVSTMQATIQRLDLPPRSDDEVRAVIGLGLYEALSTLFPGQSRADQERVREAYRDHFLGAAVRPTLFPGVRDTLASVAERGVTLAVATGKGRAGLDRELAETGLADFMAGSRCADECRSKPDPQMLEELMLSLGHEPQSTLMVGDAEFDLLMARNAGTAAIGVRGGAHDDNRLALHQPLAIIDAVTELPGMLRR